MMNGNEEWRDIEGFEGIYQISDCGRVKSLERVVPWGNGIRHIKERYLKPDKKKNRYLFFHLHPGDGTEKCEHAILSQKKQMPTILWAPHVYHGSILSCH